MRRARRALLIAPLGLVACASVDDAPASAPPDAAVVEVSAGRDHTCARFADGTARCWGDNRFGQLGDGTLTSRSRPHPVVGITGATSLGLGALHSCAIVAGGGVECWGRNADGTLGDGTTTDRSKPAAVSKIAEVEQVTAGLHHACARLRGGSLACWGRNSHGELGNGTKVASLEPTPVAGVFAAIDVGVGENRTCAVSTDGSTWCAGFFTDPDRARRRTGSGVTEFAIPTRVVAASPAAHVALGEWSVATTTPAETVEWWGAMFGEPKNPILSSEDPTPARGLAHVEQLALGANHACALVTGGMVTCWGDNLNGQLGDGTRIHRLAPTPVPGLAGVVQIALGGDHSCARLAGGKIVCWGDNRSGQLGDGTTTRRPSPVLVRF